MRVHNGLYLRDKTDRNHARGFWLDFDIRNVIVDSLKSSENLVDGVLVEAAQGPVTIRNSRIDRNKRWGIWSTNSEQLTLERNHIFNNTESQIKINGDAERMVEDFESHEKSTIKVRNWVLKENIIASNDSFLLDIIGWKHFLMAFSSNHNVWCRFKNSYVIKVSERPLRLSDWQEAMHLDANSQFHESSIDRRDPTNNKCFPADSPERLH
jgi:parallel beta-helix repeat protein